MTTKMLKTTLAAIIIAAIGVTTVAAPAQAAGQLAINYAPNNADEAGMLGLGLQLFALFNGLDTSGANVIQTGDNNAAGGSQQGSNNHGVIVQQGNGHTGTVRQQGNNNACGVFQFGANTNASCDQYGNGQTSIKTVFGF